MKMAMHMKLGHVSVDSLSMLAKKEKVVRLVPIIKPKALFETCNFGKKHKVPFPFGKSVKAKKPLNLIHSDLCGPLEVSIIGGRNYFLTFIDDFSKQAWSIF